MTSIIFKVPVLTVWPLLVVNPKGSLASANDIAMLQCLGVKVGRSKKNRYTSSRQLCFTLPSGLAATVLKGRSLPFYPVPPSRTSN